MDRTIRFDRASTPRPHLGRSLATGSEESLNEKDGAVVQAEIIEPIEDAGPVCLTGIDDFFEPAAAGESLAAEKSLRDSLLADPEVWFVSVSVHFTPDGVCLKGVLEYNENAPDVSEHARRITGFNSVLNQLVMHRASKAKRKSE